MFLAFAVDWGNVSDFIAGYESGGIFGGMRAGFVAISEYLRKGFTDLMTLLEGIYTFLRDMFAQLPYVVSLITSFLANIPSYFGWLPIECVSLLIVLFGIVGIYLIAGRN